MTLAHANGVRDSSVDIVVDEIDVGAANAAGILRFLEGAASRAEITPPNPAHASSSGQQSLLLGVPLDSTAAVATTVALDGFDWQDRDRNFVYGGSIGAVSSGEDIEMVDPTLNTNDIIRVTSWAYQAFP